MVHIRGLNFPNDRRSAPARGEVLSRRGRTVGDGVGEKKRGVLPRMNACHVFRTTALLAPFRIAFSEIAVIGLE